ncbi:MAG: IS66 family insertion sequence element accessory protein TnpB [Pseudomonadota bacterium]|nr:IS66 family insertion sequence element accessory protein TnpB [Pseudomonadota bacterium]
MLNTDNLKILFYTQPVDMRKSIDSLCILISDVLNMDPTDGSLFLFRSKGGNKIKSVYYETNCFTLWYRRLEKARFVFDRNGKGHIEMSREYFNWLLASDKYSRLETMEKPNISNFF